MRWQPGSGMISILKSLCSYFDARYADATSISGKKPGADQLGLLSVKSETARKKIIIGRERGY